MASNFKMRPMPTLNHSILMVIWDLIITHVAPPVQVSSHCPKGLRLLLQSCRVLFYWGLEHFVTKLLLPMVGQWRLPSDSYDRMLFLQKLAFNYMASQDAYQASICYPMIMCKLTSSGLEANAKELLNSFGYRFLGRKKGREQLLRLLTPGGEDLVMSLSKAKKAYYWHLQKMDDRVAMINQCIGHIKMLVQTSFAVDYQYACVFNYIQ
jgi:hypothetical protein